MQTKRVKYLDCKQLIPLFFLFLKLPELRSQTRRTTALFIQKYIYCAILFYPMKSSQSISPWISPVISGCIQSSPATSGTIWESSDMSGNNQDASDFSKDI